MCDSCCENETSLVKIDRPAPLFQLPAYDPVKDVDTKISLADLKGWKAVVFYPADFTFVCPTELKDLADAKALFDKLNVTVLVASTDTVFSHRSWVQSEGLLKGFPYTMLADHTGQTANDYHLLDEESGMAGRGTFIIDPENIVRGIEVTSGALGRNSAELIRKIEALQFMASHPGTACPARWAVGAKTLTPSIKITGHIAEELAK